MKKIKVHCSWDLEVNLFHERQLELWVDKFPGSQRSNGSVHIGVLIEPKEIRNIMGLSSDISSYDYALTHDQSLLDNNSNSFLYEFGGCWVKNYDQSTDKVFGVSTLIGGKQMTPGHSLRTSILNNKNSLSIPKTIWISRNYPPRNNPDNDPILQGGKKDMFDRQFHICIENVKRKNWFTEKLLDCLHTRTVPIYYGCPNIGDWFDIRGFIIVETLEDIIRECNKLTPEIYQKMEPYIEENYNRAQLYSNVGENIKRSIETNIIPLINK